MNHELVIWVVLAVAFAVTELATVAFVAIYLALGAAIAAVLAGSGADAVWQVLGFVVGAVVLLAATRPFLKHRLESPPVLTNVHRVIGKRAIVTIPIDNDANTGQIRVGTEYWTARTDESAVRIVLPPETSVEIVRVEGVTAYVIPVE